MGAIRQLYQGDSDYNFPRLFRWFLTMSGLVIAASIVSFVGNGLNLSIDFRGGSVWEVPSEKLTVEQAKEVLAKAGKANGAKVQEATDSDGKRSIRIQAAESKNVDESRKLAAELAKAAGIDSDLVAINSIGPSWGNKITGDAIRALIVFLVLIAAYITWQLEWRMSVAAIVALFHDMLITVGIYSIFRLEVTPATVISFLTILGFSLYDTIVVFDRVLDNAHRLDRTGQYTYSAIMRRSLNQVLTRSLNTSIVALLPVISILLIGGVAFKQSIMNDFAVALFVGLISGVFSSLAIAPPVLVLFKEREAKYRRIRQRATERGVLADAEWIPPERMGSRVGRSRDLVGAGARRGDTASTERGGGGDEGGAKPSASVSSKAALYQRPHPPRPRKQGKRR